MTGVRSAPPFRAVLLHRDLPLHGGIAQCFLSLAAHLDRETVSPTVVSLDAVGGDALQAFAEVNTPVRTLGGSFASQAFGLRALLRELKPQAVFCASFRAYLLAKFARRAEPFRTVFWLHGIALMESALKTRLFRILSREDTLLAVSQAVLYAHSYPDHRGRRLVSYNGVSEPPAVRSNPQDRSRARTLLGLAEDDVAIGYVAEFVTVKDHGTLLDAFGALARERPDLKLLLFGDGPNEREVRRLAAPVGESVRFMGVRPDVREVMAGLDAYVHPCRAEGFGLAVVEAMLAEMPVLAARAGALPELVDDGRTGTLFAAGDPADLREKLEGVLAERDHYCEMAREAGRVASERFGPSRAAREFEAVVESEMFPEGHEAG